MKSLTGKLGLGGKFPVKDPDEHISLHNVLAWLQNENYMTHITKEKG